MRDQLENAAEEVHETLGSGFTESIYHRSLERELSERQIPFSSEGTVPVMYKGAPVGRRRPDLFIMQDNGDVIVTELKAGSNSGEAQLREYLELTHGDSNFGDITGGAVIRFNDELEFDYYKVNDDGSVDTE